MVKNEKSFNNLIKRKAEIPVKRTTNFIYLFKLHWEDRKFRQMKRTDVHNYIANKDNFWMG